MSTRPKLWSMNADFEIEVAGGPSLYCRRPTIAWHNRRLAPYLLWLASPGDGLLVEEPWGEALRAAAAEGGVELVVPHGGEDQSGRDFAPWGWTANALALARSANARVVAPPLDVVARVNSKLFSHALERELGVEIAGSAVVRDGRELARAAERACPGENDKWVVKSPFGFAARERVLGRGPTIDDASRVWAERRFAAGEALLFEPWLDVVREYGVQIMVRPAAEGRAAAGNEGANAGEGGGIEGGVEIVGVSDLQTNGAGAATGYIVGRPPSPERLAQLEALARDVGARLAREGYFGPAGIDALEHAGGFRPLVEINARWTMGFVALAVERHLAPTAPVFWSLKSG